MIQQLKQQKFFLLVISLTFLLAACGGNSEETADSEPTAEPVVVQTVVVVATPTTAPIGEASEPSEETAPAVDAPVLEAPAAQPGEPTMTALVDLNVRTGPGTNYPSVGALRAGSSARIIGQSPDGFWWKIECPPGAGSECWSSAGSQYASAANAGGVLVAAVPPAPTHVPAATSAATEIAQVSPTATATMDNNGETPTITATPPTGNEATPTAAATPPTENNTPTATATEPGVPLADFDNDSLQNPATSVFFRPTGTRNFSYSNAISFPDGDQDDWVEFEFPNNSNTAQRVWITLNCSITGDPGAQVRATVWEDGVKTTKIVLCGQGETQLTVDNTKTQQLQIHFGIASDPVYATYDLTVVGFK